MSNEKDKGGEFLAGFIIGGLVGAAIALILAPGPGEETRARLKERGIELKGRAEDLSEEARKRTEEARKQAEEVAEEARRRAEELAEEQRSRLQEAVEEGKKTAAQKKNELLARLEAEKAQS